MLEASGSIKVSGSIMVQNIESHRPRQWLFEWRAVQGSNLRPVVSKQYLMACINSSWKCVYNGMNVFTSHQLALD
jgi:hypothetical protein